jgi:hypothetical protein
VDNGVTSAWWVDNELVDYQGETPSIIPGFKTVSMRDIIMQPGSKTAAPPMMKEDAVRVRQVERHRVLLQLLLERRAHAAHRIVLCNLAALGVGHDRLLQRVHQHQRRAHKTAPIVAHLTKFIAGRCIASIERP